MGEAIGIAHASSEPFNVSWCLNWAARFYQCRREVQRVHEHIEASLKICIERGFVLNIAVGKILQGWVLAVQGQDAQGIASMQEGFEAWKSVQAEAQLPYFIAMLVEGYHLGGRPDAGLKAVDEALRIVHKNAEHFYEAELYRLKGELLLQLSSDNAAEAEVCFQKAIAIAQNQSAKSLELRAATSLARLWTQQGKRDEARELLGNVYGWFTEGFDTADLKDAKALLDELT